MPIEMHNRLATIKSHIENNEPITKEELADITVIALYLENLLNLIIKCVTSTGFVYVDTDMVRGNDSKTTIDVNALYTNKMKERSTNE